MGQVSLESLQATKDRAIVEIESSSMGLIETSGGLFLSRSQYRPNEDFEIGKVVSLGAGDFDPVAVGDYVMIRAISGGKAGADISREVGMLKGSVISIHRDEIVAKVE